MALVPAGARALDTSDTRLLSTPAITDGKIAFVYADDIWVADADGTNPEAVDVAPGRGAEPVLLARRQAHRLHGQLRRQRRRLRDPHRGGRADAADLAPRRGHRPRLHARRQGALQLARERSSRAGTRSSSRSASTGGVPRAPADPHRPTWGPSRPTANSWPTRRSASGSASGRTIAAARPRGSGSSSSMTCRTRRSPSPPAAATTPSRCGSARRSTSSPIATASSTCTRTIGKSKKVARCTEHDDFPVASASAGAGKVIYEQAGWIHLFDPAVGRVAPAQDRRGRRPGRDPAPLRQRREAHPRTSGSRPPASGPCSSTAARSSPSRPRRATRTTSPQTPGAHERSPAWSPDGKSIAYFSDASGEYALVVRPQDGKGEGRVLPAQGGRLLRAAGLVARQQEDRLHRQLADALLDRPRHRRRQADRRRADLRPGQVTHELRLVARLEVAGLHAHQPRRLPDDPALLRSTTDKSHAADRRPGRGRRAGLRRAAASTSTSSPRPTPGPVKNWFDQSITDMQATRSVYLVTLAKATANPLLKESDEEGADEAGQG